MSDFVTYSRDNDIGVITVNHPPVNALSAAVRQGIKDCAEALEQDAQAKAGVLICEGRTFIAGADITEFGKVPRGPTFHQALNILEGLKKPIVAAIHGTALGGGLETALCCHYRCAVPSAQVGLPEVKLGLLPGAGGTQRLPRLVGVPIALDMITTGDPIPAAEALKLGVIDKVIEGDLRAGAIAFARQLVQDKKPLRKVRDMEDKIKPLRGNKQVFDDYRKSMAHRARGFEAPYAIVDCIDAAVNMPFDEGIAFEQKGIATLMAGLQSQSQRYMFFAEREAAKIHDVPKDTPVAKVKRAAVLGAGTMGGGIAMNFANAGIPVYLLDTGKEQLDRGMDIIRKNYTNTMKKGRLTQTELDQRMRLITPTMDEKLMGEADFVIEAVFEEMGLKKEVFAKLDRICRKDAIMATNTSTLDVDEIAAATSRPEKVIGTHFFSPANVMRLIEVVRGKKSSKETIATTMALSKTLGKIAVLVGVCDGFVGNRILHQRQREADFLLEEGALPEQVDKVLFDFGLPMGPFAMGDLAGLDVSWRIRKGKAATRSKDERYSTLPDQVCELGRFGQKTGAGWFKYEGGSRTPIPDPAITQLIEAESKRLGIKRRKITDEEIIARLIYPMINEGAKILEEGMALRPSDVDVIWVYGYGWPKYRGGPMFYGDSIGLNNVYTAMKKFEELYGKKFAPAPLLEKLAKAGKTFQAHAAGS